MTGVRERAGSRSDGEGAGVETIPGWEGRTASGWAEKLGLPRLELHPTVSSTNDRLRELAETGSPAFTAVVADAQLQGRGRGGKAWVSPGGSGLWISILLPAPIGGPPGATTLAVGVAVAEGVEAGTGRRCRLKWPNDLLLSSGKVGGILCESVCGGKAIVAGIGLNLRPPGSPVPGRPDEARADTALEKPGPGAISLPPQGAAYLENHVDEPDSPAGSDPPAVPHSVSNPPAISHSVSNPPAIPDPGSISTPRLFQALVDSLRRWADPPPSRVDAKLRRAWSDRDALSGQWVRTSSGITGRVLGIGDSGALLVEVEGGTVEEVQAGSVRRTAGEYQGEDGAEAPRGVNLGGTE